MFVTKKTHTEAISHLEWAQKWHKETQSDMRQEFWALKNRHEELLDYLELTQERVDAHYEIRRK